jgi:NAD(P)-dependent dehydrogenase (short-subunit alcohol dehydrogenase family)
MSDERIAIVTGAAQGVGLVTASTLARMGYRTILTDIQSLDGALEKLTAPGSKVEGLVADISSEDFVRELAQRVEHNYGPRMLPTQSLFSRTASSVDS